MTPTEYLNNVRRLARKRDMVGILALSDEHLTDAMLDQMTPQQRRDVHSAIHVAARFVGEGPLDGTRGIPVDDLEEADLAEVATDACAPRVKIT